MTEWEYRFARISGYDEKADEHQIASRIRHNPGWEPISVTCDGNTFVVLLRRPKEVELHRVVQDDY